MGKKKTQINNVLPGDVVDTSQDTGKLGKKSRRNRGQEFEDDLSKDLESLAIETGVEIPEIKKKDMPEVKPVKEEDNSEVKENAGKKEIKKTKKNRRKGNDDEHDDVLAELEAEMLGLKPKLDPSKPSGESSEKPNEKAKETAINGNSKDANKKKVKVSQEKKTADTKNKKEAKEQEPKGKKGEKDNKAAAKGKKGESENKATAKGKEEEPVKQRKGPGKRAIEDLKFMQQKFQEEKDRLQKLEDEERKKEDERIRIALQDQKIAAEKKEIKKQKQKDKLKRQREEGTYLTKTQKEKEKRTQAALEAFREQGKIPVDMTQPTPKKSFKKRPNKPKEIVVEDEPIPVQPEIVEVEEEKSNVKDAWDAESSDSESEESQSSENTQTKDASASKDSSPTPEDEESSDSEMEHMTDAEKRKERARLRMAQRKEESSKNIDPDVLRSPVVCVLGHVDHGKTKILDKLRKTNVQEGEVGGITQQIGATNVPFDAVRSQTRMVKDFSMDDLKFPGLLIIDTPGHESFSNLRTRGSSLCDIAILVIDITQGLEPQTIESINLLKSKKTPFVVALNKVDRVFEWDSHPTRDIREAIKAQAVHSKNDFEKRTSEIIQALNEEGLNAALFWENPDPRSYVSLVPTSAISGDGMGNLIALVCQMCQKRLASRLLFSEELQCTVLEVKAIQGHGTTIDVILINGRLKEGNTIILAGIEGPIVTQIRSLLLPKPMKEIRVKGQYDEHKEIKAAQGIKLAAKDLDKAIAGLNLSVAHHEDEIEFIKEAVDKEFRTAMRAIKVKDKGVYVQASTLGALEALLEFFKKQKIPFSGIRIGPVVKRDVMKAAAMLEHEQMYAVILAFDVKVEKDAQELADKEGVRIFSEETIYHLGDRYVEYQKDYKKKQQEENSNVAVFPCKLKIIPDAIFNKRDPIVLGVNVEAGILRTGTPLCVPSKEGVEIGIVTSMEFDHKQVERAKPGVDVCIKIQPASGHTPKLFGRHFDETDTLVSKISRAGIDACKAYFRDDLSKSDWKLMAELKRQFQII